MVPITALYAGLLMLVGAALGYHVGSMRGATKISILHGENMELATRMRRHGNFVENAPIAIAFLAILELNGASSVMLHSLGLIFVVTRILHPIGLHHDNIGHPLRAIGALGTFLALLFAAGAAIWQFVSA